MDATQAALVIERAVGELNLEFDGVSLSAAGKRSRLVVTLDGDGPNGSGLNLDEIAAAANAISAALDESGMDGDAPYTLEVTTRGVNAPLTQPGHWRRNAGRLVEVVIAGDPPVLARITAERDRITDTAVPLLLPPTAPAETSFEFQRIERAQVQVEFNRTSAGAGENVREE